MSEGIDIVFAQGHHHGFELCVYLCARLHVRAYVYLLLGNDHKISSYTTAIAG